MSQITAGRRQTKERRVPLKLGTTNTRTEVCSFTADRPVGQMIVTAKQNKPDAQSHDRSKTGRLVNYDCVEQAYERNRVRRLDVVTRLKRCVFVPSWRKNKTHN